MDREKLAQRITDSPIPRDEADLLLRRLKVASCEGCAAVVRDFDTAMARERARVLKSHRHRGLGRSPSPMNKLMPVLSFK
jgi:hypothetical protein